MNCDFRFYVLTQFKLGKTVSMIHNDLVAVHGDTSPCKRTIQGWIQNILSGDFSLKKTPPPGRPISNDSRRNADAVKSLVDQYSNLSCAEIASELSLSKSTVHWILTNILMYRNVYAIWVPSELNDSHKIQRINCCNAILDMFRTHSMDYIASHYCVEDESWFFWDSKTSRKNWIGKTAKKPTLARPKLTDRKTMVLVSFTCKPKRYSVSVLPRKTTVDSKMMIDYLKSTGKRFNNHRGGKISFKDLLLQMDNARPHASRATQGFLANSGVQLIKQSPYSPDLNLCDRFLFRKIKSDLMGVDSDGPDDVRRKVQHIFRHMSENELVRQLWKLQEHAKHVIDSQGDYVNES